MSETKNTTPFSQQLAYINKGTLDAELTEALAEVIKAVRETGKKGAVTLTLNCSMLNTRDENTMKVTPKVSQPVSNRDELPPDEIECDICGHVSTDQEGRHHCCEDNSND